MTNTPKFDFRFIDTVDDEDDDNVDVTITFEDGSSYIISFFTLSNIQTLMRRYAGTGECAGGKYFWASDMVIVKNLKRETIEAAIRDLLSTVGSFDTTFCRQS